MTAWGSVPGVKRPERETNHSLPYSGTVLRLRCGELYLHSPTDPKFSWWAQRQIDLPSQNLNVFLRSISMYYFMILNQVARVSIRHHKFERLPWCYCWLWEIRKCGVGKDLNSIAVIRYFVANKPPLKCERTHLAISASFLPSRQ
jgi:hypothetical protein